MFFMQALDSSYRAAVASLIQRQAHSSENPTQFITTTFRPEMVAVASRCYGISHQNKVCFAYSSTLVCFSVVFLLLFCFVISCVSAFMFYPEYDVLAARAKHISASHHVF